MRANLMTISPEFLEKRKYELQNLKDTWFRALIRAEKERMEQFLEKGKLGTQRAAVLHRWGSI